MTDLNVTRSGSTAVIELNRPDKLNALSPAVLNRFVEVCRHLARDDDLRVVVLRGAGRGFSAGADLPAFESAFAAGDASIADLGRLASDALWRLPQITIAAIHGHCVGGALVLAACCDLRLAADSARFSIPEIDAGIPLAWGGMEHLYRLIGETRTTELVLTCRPFDAEEALAAGFLTRIVAADALDSAVDRLSTETARKARAVLRSVKAQLTALRDGRFDPVEDAAALLAARADPEACELGAAYVATRIRKDSRHG